MAKFIAVTALWALGILLSIWIMMYGWGLEPHSWGWIIGGGVAGRILLIALELATKSENQ